MKMCWGCEQDLPAEMFHRDAGKKDGLQSKCKTCQYARYLERLAEDPEKVRAIGRESARRNRKRQLYGITNEQFDTMVAERAGRCDACGVVPPPREKTYGGLVVDHCHATGVIRGLTCHSCNRGFGLLGDTADSVRRRLAYLEAFEAFTSKLDTGLTLPA